MQNWRLRYVDEKNLHFIYINNYFTQEFLISLNRTRTFNVFIFNHTNLRIIALPKFYSLSLRIIDQGKKIISIHVTSLKCIELYDDKLHRIIWCKNLHGDNFILKITI